MSTHNKKVIAIEGLIIIGILVIGSFTIFISDKLPMPKPVKPQPDLSAGRPAEEGFVKDLETGNTYRKADFEIRQSRSRNIREFGFLAIIACPLFLLLRFVFWAVKALMGKK